MYILLLFREPLIDFEHREDTCCQQEDEKDELHACYDQREQHKDKENNDDNNEKSKDHDVLSDEIGSV